MIEHVVVKFNEFMLRTSVLKMSPYVKNFIEKITDIEKNGKAALDVIEEHSLLQQKWLYLQSIFNQDNLSDSLQKE
jgi:hypothetical protein